MAYSFGDAFLAAVKTGMEERRVREQMALAQRQQDETERANRVSEEDRARTISIQEEQAAQNRLSQNRTYIESRAARREQERQNQFVRDEATREIALPGRVDDPNTEENEATGLAGYVGAATMRASDVPLFSAGYEGEMNRDLTREEGAAGRALQRRGQDQQYAIGMRNARVAEQHARTAAAQLGLSQDQFRLGVMTAAATGQITPDMAAEFGVTYEPQTSNGFSDMAAWATASNPDNTGFISQVVGSVRSHFDGASMSRKREDIRELDRLIQSEGGGHVIRRYGVGDSLGERGETLSQARERLSREIGDIQTRLSERASVQRRAVNPQSVIESGTGNVYSDLARYRSLSESERATALPKVSSNIQTFLSTAGRYGDYGEQSMSEIARYLLTTSPEVAQNLGLVPTEEE